MAAVPLDDASVGAAVFSLALMGTDYGAFLLEAKRVSKDIGRACSPALTCAELD